MELVRLPGAIGHYDLIETAILEVLQTLRARHLGVEALTAKLPVASRDGAVIHYIIARYRRTACFAAGHVGSMRVFLPHTRSHSSVSSSAR